MYWLSKLLGSLLVPPGLLLLVAILATVSVYRNRQQETRTLMVLILTLLYGLSIQPVAEGLLLPLEDWHPPLSLLSTRADVKDAGYIMVLGGGVVENSPEYGGASILAEEPLKRIDYALDLHQRFGLPLIVSGGKPIRNSDGLSEGEVFKQYCLKRGIAEAAILVESKSRTTAENMAATKRLYNPQRVILVTSAYHMPRAVLLATQNGISSMPAPTAYKAKRIGYSWQSFLPNKGAMYNSSVAIKEYIGLLFYTLSAIF